MADKAEYGPHETAGAGESRAVALRQRSEATAAARRWFNHGVQARDLNRLTNQEGQKHAQERSEAKARFFLKRDERQMRDLFKKRRKHNG